MELLVGPCFEESGLWMYNTSPMCENENVVR
jgi:hypothetical protein